MQPGIYLIGEVGQAHEGSLGLAHSYIDALSNTGVNAVKFQTHIAEAESSIHEQFRVRFSYLDETRMEYWKRMEFTQGQWTELKKHCESKNLEFISTPSSLAAVDLLNNVGVHKFKVGSGDANNLLLLKHIAETGKEIILSTGMSSTGELDQSVQYLQRYGNQLSLLQCTSSYPTCPKQWGLNLIQELENRYGLPVGFSDHSGQIYACLAAAAAGAHMLEFHTVFDHRMFGPDSTSSLNIGQVKALVRGVRQIETALGNPVSKEPDSALKDLFEKSLAINKDLQQGQLISLSDLDCKKPKHMGIPANEFEWVVGKKINKDLKKWTFINKTDLSHA